MEAFIINVIW